MVSNDQFRVVELVKIANKLRDIDAKLKVETDEKKKKKLEKAFEKNTRIYVNMMGGSSNGQQR